MRGGATEYVTVYTDIAAPKPTLFSEVEGYDSLTDRELTIVSDDHAGLAASDAFPSAKLQTFTYSDADTTPAPMFRGTLQGAPGTYECTSTSCTAETDADGKLMTLSSGWTFTFDEGAMVDVADTDHLHFGWWLNSPDKANDDGDYDYQIRTFTGGSDVFTARNITGLEGTATYAGPAGGMFVRKELTSTGEVDTARSGSFTADTKLTASFGGDGVAVDDQFSIIGTVMNFMDGDGASLGGWMVKLNKSTDFESTGAFTGTTEGTKGGTAGTWDGTFYGNGEETTDHPSGVAGTFNAHFINGHVSGGYGAAKQAE